MPFRCEKYDINETRNTERRSDLLRTTLRSIGDAVIATDAQGRVRFLNPVAERLTGWTESDALDRDSTEVFRIVNEETRNPVESPIEKVIRDGVVVGLANHTVLIDRAGTERPIDDSGAPIRDEKGDLIGTVVVFRDISERRRTEAQMALLAAVVEDSEDAIYTKTLDGVVTSWNPAAERMYGYPAAEMVGQPVGILAPPDKPNEVPEILTRVARGERIRHYETERITRDGRILLVSKSISPLRNPRGEIIGASSIVRDMTESIRQKREIEALNQRLHRAMRETHHRIKNSLQVITALINVQAMDHGETVPATVLTRVSQHVAGLAAIHDLLTTGSKAAEPSQLLSLRAVLEKLVPILRTMMDDRNLVTDLDDVLLPPRHMTALTVLTNELVSNGIKHGAGTVRITVRLTKGRACLEVRDEGPGFPEGEPVERTASTGLELVRAVVLWDMAGKVEFRNSPEGGASVVVEFPVPVYKDVE
jgi:PAS domain S-box